MGYDFNQIRKPNAKLIKGTIDKLGTTYAVEMGGDGFSSVTNVVAPMPTDIKEYLEGNTEIEVYACASNIDKLCEYALASFPNIEDLYLFKNNGVVTIEDDLSYLENLKLMYVASDYVSSYSSYTIITSDYQSFTSVDDYVGKVVDTNLINNKYTTFTSVDDYLKSYVVYNGVMTYVTNDNKNDLGIVAGTTIAYFGASVYKVTNDNKNDLFIVSGVTVAYDRLVTNIVEDYTLTIPYVGIATLTSEYVDSVISMLSAGQKNAITKLVIPTDFTQVSADNIAWNYDFSALPNLDDNIWYGTIKYDFTTKTLVGSDELLESDITNFIATIGNDKRSGVLELHFEGFSDMSVALTYDYSALPNLEYLWLDNVRYEKNSLYHILPTGYKEYECLEMPRGTSGIDTNVDTGSKKTDVIFYVNRLNGHNYDYVIRGCSDLENNANDAKIQFQTPVNKYININFASNTKHKVKIHRESGNTYIEVDDVKLATSTDSFEYEISNCMLGIITGGQSANMYIYSLEIIQDNYHAYFVPSLNPQELKGFYDIINNVFVCNSSGWQSSFNLFNVIEQFINPTYFYPLSNLETEYNANLNQTFYIDYNGTLPSYPNYQLTYYTDINCTTSILPTELVSGTRYYVKAVMVTLVIQGSGTLTSAIVEEQVSKAGSGVTKVIVPNTFTYSSFISVIVGNESALFSSLTNLSHWNIWYGNIEVYNNDEYYGVFDNENYTKCDYIDNNYRRVDTNIVARNNLHITYIHTFISVPEFSIISDGQQDVSTLGVNGTYSGGKFRYNSVANNVSTGYYSTDIKYKLELIDNEMYVDDILLSSGTKATFLGNNIGLSYYQSYVDQTRQTRTKTYILNIKDISGTPLLNYQPCYRNSDNAYGFYDTYNQTFITNENYTGGNDE